jgi:hypothetical protein
LKQETRDYLQRIWRERAANHPGVFVQRNDLALTVLAGLVGLVLLATMAYGLNPKALYRSLGIQCTLAAVGLLCLTYCARKVYRRFHSKALGEFTYCDGTWNWEVRGPRVMVTDVSKVAAVQIIQRLRNDVPVSATVELSMTGGGAASFAFSSPASAQDLGRFLQACRAVRYRCFMGEFSPNVRQFVADPAGLAQLARRVMDSPDAPVSLEHRALIPIPNPPQI